MVVLFDRGTSGLSRTFVLSCLFRFVSRSMKSLYLVFKRPAGRKVIDEELEVDEIC